MNVLSLPKVTAPFRNAERRQESWLAPSERRCLLWLAGRMPVSIQPDHLTLLGLAALALAGASYALSALWAPLLLVVNLWLAVNWFGDSLDGTLARYRNRQRPRYGFYVDHMADSFWALLLIGGLALSGRVSGLVATALLVLFLLLSINSYLATYTLGTFQLSFWKFGPTELRILLAIGNVFALWRPEISFLGDRQMFFDVAGGIGAIAMAVVLVCSAIMNTTALYRAERL